MVRPFKSEEIIVRTLSNKWYENADGYDPSFLGEEYEVSHPQLRCDLQQDVVTLEDGSYVLPYTHFSIVMKASRRLAYYTVVNIDGNQLVDVERTKDRWYFDTRIGEEYQCGPELYERNDIDRGHLVRRRDPVWGNEAEKANEDTFHFTNCAPQHQDFNQKTWLELEDYLLNNARNRKSKVTIFTGPVFREDDIEYRGVQLPEEFWKIAVFVKEDGSMSATAYLQSQKHLIQDLQTADDNMLVYQVPIPTIEALTGLNFGALREFDPKAQDVLEINHIIESSRDIEL
jgi:endonuclease G